MAQAVLVMVAAEPPQAIPATLKMKHQVHKKNRIQVSNTKKPLFFYLNLAKRYIKQYNDVELSALGMAIPTLVTIAGILKANGVAVEKKVLTSTIGAKDASKGRVIQKAKLEIVLERNDKSPTSTDDKSATSADDKSATSADENAKPVPETETKAVADKSKTEAGIAEKKGECSSL